MKRQTALNLKTGKYEKLTSTGMKDEYGKIIWIDQNGNEVANLERHKHFGRTEFTFYPCETK
jgi:hypothetical protein